MTRAEMLARTRRFALRAVKFVTCLPAKPEMRTIGMQLLRSATSVGANYRAACRARSRAEFISKMSIVEEEADESQYWLELLADLAVPAAAELRELSAEASQIVAIAVASKKTARRGGLSRSTGSDA